MALAEVVIGVALAKLLEGSSSSAKGAQQKPPDAPPNRDQGAVNPTAVIGSIAGIGSAILSAAGGVGGGGATVAAGTGAAVGTKTAGGTSAATSGTAAGGGVSLSVVAAVVIVVVWVVLVVLAVFLMVDAANRRAVRAALGLNGIRERYLSGIRKLENEYARAMIEANKGEYTLEWVTAGDYGYNRVSGFSGLSTETLGAIATASRFQAVETFRALNRSVLTYFVEDFGWSPSQIAAAGDALEPGDFESVVSEVYQPELFQKTGEARSFAQAQSLMSAPEVLVRVAQARFNGKMAAIAYVQGVLSHGTLFPAGISRLDAQQAAAASPPGNNSVAYTNRVFGLGEEQKASVLFDNDARLAWLPLHSPPGQPALWPYETKAFIKDSFVGT